MKFTTTAVVAIAGVASANIVKRSVDPAQATASLIAALPVSIELIAATNTAEAASIISSELSGPTPPSWFLSLPPDVQTYFITSAEAAATESASSAVSSASSAVSSASSVASSVSASAKNATSSLSSKFASGSSGSGASATASSVSSSGLAALPTAIIGGGLAGAIGILGVLAL